MYILFLCIYYACQVLAVDWRDFTKDVTAVAAEKLHQCIIKHGDPLPDSTTVRGNGPGTTETTETGAREAGSLCPTPPSVYRTSDQTKSKGRSRYFASRSGMAPSPVEGSDIVNAVRLLDPAIPEFAPLPLACEATRFAKATVVSTDEPDEDTGAGAVAAADADAYIRIRTGTGKANMVTTGVGIGTRTGTAEASTATISVSEEDVQAGRLMIASAVAKVVAMKLKHMKDPFMKIQDIIHDSMQLLADWHRSSVLQRRRCTLWLFACTREAPLQRLFLNAGFGPKQVVNMIQVIQGA